MNLLQYKNIETRCDRGLRHVSAQGKAAQAGVPQETKPQDNARSLPQNNKWRWPPEVKKNGSIVNAKKSFPNGLTGAFPKKIDVHAIGRELQQNPEQACSMSTVN